MEGHLIPFWLPRSLSVYAAAAAAATKSLQSCLILCDPIDGSQQGSSVPGILQPRTLERVVSSFSNAWMWKVKVKSLSHVQLFATPWTAAYQAPPPMGFSRQEYWSGVPLPSLTTVHRCPLIPGANMEFTSIHPNSYTGSFPLIFPRKKILPTTAFTLYFIFIFQLSK